ncbi:MAG: endolytic transglycosylase MltG [Bacteroidales bacterium]
MKEDTKKNIRKYLQKYLLIGSVIIVIVVVLLLRSGYSTIFKANTREGVGYLYIPTGATYEQLLDSIRTLGRIVNINSFERVAKFEKLQANIKPGRFKIEEGMGNREIVRAIKYGWQAPTKIIIAGNIRTKEKLALILSRKIESDSLSILNLLNNENFADSLGFNSQTFLAMFLPNTYEVYWTITPKELVIKLKTEYDKFWNNERVAKAKSIGLSPVEVITLASIVSQESNIKEEQPIIAGVYMNRLHNKIPLQADPTIKFALNDTSIKRILFKHLKINSPYNTYKNLGLPPGPIVIPSLFTIDAVLNYKRHSFWYFCAKPSLDGSHCFSSTLAGHNRNARAYQKAISRL